MDALTATVQGFVEKEGGKVQKVEKWGKKRLAYLVKQHREGSYVLLVADGGRDMVKEVERRIRVTDGVIKFMTVRVDEELKKAERRKAKRTAEDEKRRSRSPERPAPAPLPPCRAFGGGAAVSFGGCGRPGGGGRRRWRRPGGSAAERRAAAATRRTRASATSSGAARSASSARTRSTTSTTRT